MRLLASDDQIEMSARSQRLIKGLKKKCYVILHIYIYVYIYMSICEIFWSVNRIRPDSTTKRDLEYCMIGMTIHIQFICMTVHTIC